MNDKLFEYGMRLRGFAPLCQPMNGFVERKDDKSGKYHDILVYDRELTNEELRDYELDDLNDSFELERNLSVTLKVNGRGAVVTVVDNESGDAWSKSFPKKYSSWMSDIIESVGCEVASWIDLMEDQLDDGR